MKKLDILSFEEAKTKALENAKKELSSEVVFLKDALGRVLAEDIKVRKNVPSFNNSALDGFAFRHADKNEKLKIAATIYAGDEPKEILQKNECYKIMTVAKVPSD